MLERIYQAPFRVDSVSESALTEAPEPPKFSDRASTALAWRAGIGAPTSRALPAFDISSDKVTSHNLDARFLSITNRRTFDAYIYHTRFLLS